MVEYLMEKILLGFLLFFAQVSFAEEAVKELPPLDPAYMGVHNMALITHGSIIYATNLSTYQKPNNVQLLYKIDNKNLAILQTIRDSQLVTIVPKPFNLQRLMRGEKMLIQADVYSGHFQRGGMLVYENISLAFDKKLYVRSFDDIKPSSKQQEYDVVSLKDNYRFYIHKVQKSPSFAHILGVDLTSSCLNFFRTSSPVPNETELQYKFINCGTIKPLYFETKDFENKDFEGNGF